ncbi:Hypothetical predicted protein [Octopus vulgaris]|uniref:Choline transporter-like protein n=1 Tax=Octopus vulgaris TaxID=6645 RepID=A0AA36AIY2_OCTVU|nr:Hypothetical predicted protein [Octopus vulgaris]
MCGNTDEEDTTDSGYSSKFGPPIAYDPTFRGPVKSRNCTDVFCCILFVICVASMIGVSVFGFIHGDPRRLLYPTDSKGNICGYGEFVDRPKLVFFDLLTCSKMGRDVESLGCPTPQVCVKECPTENYVYLESAQEEKANRNKILQKERERLICKYGVDRMTRNIQDLVSQGLCTAYYVKSISVAHRCIPAVFKSNSMYDVLQSGNSTVKLMSKDGDKITPNALAEATRYLIEFHKFQEYGEMIFSDIKNSWLLIVVCFLIAVLISLVWVILLRCIAAVLVWVTLIAFFALLGFVIYYTFNTYVELKNSGKENDFGLTPAFAGNFEYYLGLEQTWLAAGIICSVIFVVCLLLLIFVAKKLCLAIELIKEASRASTAMIFTFIWPFVPFLLEAGILFYWITSAIYLATMGRPETYRNVVNISHGMKNLSRIHCNNHNGKFVEDMCDFVHYGDSKYAVAFEVFLLFMVFWLISFVTALNQMVLSGAFATYYWSYNKKMDIPTFPILASFGRAIRYHLGSLAFGSLIVAIVKFIRVILEFISYKLRNSHNKVARFMLKCFSCCFWCLENFLKFLNKNAYIQIAIHGKSFCVAAKKAFALIMRNPLNTVIMDKVTDLILFLSKLMVTAAVAFIAIAVLQHDPNLSDIQPGYLTQDKPFSILSLSVIVIGSYFIADCFFCVYEMAVDTIFLCFTEDTERNDGSPDRPYYMSTQLMKILGKKNKLLNSNNSN